MKPFVPETAVKLRTLVNITDIVSIHYFEFDKNFHFPGERHNYWEMVYVDSGNVLVSAEGVPHTLGQGEIIFHKPNEFHTISADKKTPSNVCVISFVAKGAAMNLFRDAKFTLPKALKPFINTVIQEGRATFDLPFNDPNMGKLQFSKNPPPGGLQLIKAALEQMFIHLVRAKESGKKKQPPQETIHDSRLVNEIIGILEANVYGKIKVGEICQMVNYSKTYISKVFNETVGQTIISYYTNLKIKEAKKLIRERTYSFTEIANMLCFNDPHCFSKVFKKVTNMSPREYLHSVTIYMD
ncbi:MAG: AraC family transcriptional regulator [Clostridia bacterium]|nr:AraC family transcriptional regulator [Clostridia bacterium]